MACEVTIKLHVQESETDKRAEGYWRFMKHGSPRAQGSQHTAASPPWMRNHGSHPPAVRVDVRSAWPPPACARADSSQPTAPQPSHGTNWMATPVQKQRQAGTTPQPPTTSRVQTKKAAYCCQQHGCAVFRAVTQPVSGSPSVPRPQIVPGSSSVPQFPGGSSPLERPILPCLAPPQNRGGSWVRTRGSAQPAP